FVLSLITAVWSLSALISVPPSIGWNDWSAEHLAYTCELTQDKAFVVYSSCGSFYIPLIVMTTVYAKIFLAARKRLRSKGTMARGRNNNKSGGRIKNEGRDKDGLTDNGQGASSAPKIRPLTALPPMVRPLEALNVHKVYKDRERISVSKEKKAAKTLAIIMGVFVLCWLPFFCIYLLKPFCKTKCRIHPKVEETITWLGYINSAINPVIYTIFNMDFRKAFSKYLCFLRRSRRRPRRTMVAATRPCDMHQYMEKLVITDLFTCRTQVFAIVVVSGDSPADFIGNFKQAVNDKCSKYADLYQQSCILSSPAGRSDLSTFTEMACAIYEIYCDKPSTDDSVPVAEASQLPDDGPDQFSRSVRKQCQANQANFLQYCAKNSDHYDKSDLSLRLSCIVYKHYCLKKSRPGLK
uniref:G-protein coupled receptors family 1 profile domain-containing protein n=1 Tax=Romanomermis culicivorax TaxID=13658 RepID=A0A915J640_ROMCU